MELRRELLVSIGAVLLLNLVLAFGAIGLFARMGPAIGHILEDNVVSIGAAEDMLAELADLGEGAMDPESRAHFEAALLRVRQNITEASEGPVLEALSAVTPGALDGDAAARRQLVTHIRNLIAINRDAMRRADDGAQHLGSAGAWAAVVVGALSFALTLGAFGRLRRRIVRPVVELHDALESVQQGNRLRRCRSLDAPMEIKQLVRAINSLLDDRLRGDHRDNRRREGLEQLALCELMGSQPEPAALVDNAGEIVRANDAMLESLASERGEQIRSAMRDRSQTQEGLQRTALGDAGWLVTLRAA